MSKVRKIQIELEAFRFDVDDKPDWFQSAIDSGRIDYQDDGHCLCFSNTEPTAAGQEIYPGHWVILHMNGEIVGLKPHVFERMYGTAQD